MARIHEQAQTTITMNGQQAAQMMDLLSDRAETLKEKLKQAFDAGDVAKQKKYQKELDNTQKTMASMRKEAIDVEKVLKDINGASMNELRLALSKVTKEYKRMKQTDAGFKEKEEEIKKLTNQYNTMKAQLKGIQASTAPVIASQVGLGSKFMMFTSFVSKNPLLIGSALASLAGVSRFLGSMIRRTNEFEKALSSLSAITGVTGNELDFYRSKAMEYSSTTLKSAKDILLAFELVGSIRPDLLRNSEALAEVTKQAIILSEATGGKLSLEDAARATAGTLNQFMMQSDQASRVINALAAGSKYGAASVIQITDAIKDFGAVASAGNVSLEQSIGLIETLAERQIIGAEAGTKLRNVLIILQADTKNYKDGIFDVNLALDNLGKENLNVTELTKIFGRENVVAAQILVQARDKVNEYTAAVTNTNVALEQQNVQNRNVAGALTALSNSWDTFMLKLNKSNGWLYNNLRFINAIMDAINKEDATKEENSLYNFDTGLIDDIELAKKSLDELKEIQARLLENQTEYLENWKTSSGNNKAIWAAEFDKAKENAEKVSLAIQSIENEDKKKESEIKRLEEEKKRNLTNTIEKEITAYDKLSNSIRELEENLKNLAIANKPIPNTMIHELAKKRSELEKVNQSIASIGNEIGRMTLIKTPKSIKLTTDNTKNKDNKDKLKNREDKTTETIKNPDKQADDLKKEIEDWRNAYLSIAESTTNSIFDILQNKRDQELNLALSNLDEQMQAELAVKGLTEDQKFRIQEKYRKKEEEIKKAAFKRDKAASIAKAIINTAIAVTAALPNIPLAIAAGVAGAAEIAVITSQNGYKKGGYTENDYSNDTPVGIVHANEFVANAGAVNNPTVRPMFDLINYAQQNGTISTLNLPAAMAASGMMMQAGASGNSTQNISLDASMMLAAVAEFKAVVKQLQDGGIETHLDYYRLKRMMDKESKAISKTK